MNTLPAPSLMYRALVRRDRSFDGAFFAAVKTTAIFCRPGCGAKKPRRENVEFFARAADALRAGYRACRRCRPLDASDETPEFVARVRDLAERHEGDRLTAADLRAHGIDPTRTARWFKAHYGVTFQGWHRALRLGRALRAMQNGASVGRSTAKSGFRSDSGFRSAFERVFGVSPKDARDAKSGVLVARWLSSPLGPLLAVANDAGVCLLEFTDRRALETQIRALRQRVPGAVVPGTNAHLDRLADELREWFAGKRRTFGVPLVVAGTPFQERVWEQLARIPYGETRSYADLAKAIGRPTATRAVAHSNGMNRLAILIPCHRVIAADGSLSGYGGGKWRKERLLAIEGVTLDA